VRLPYVDRKQEDHDIRGHQVYGKVLDKVLVSTQEINALRKLCKSNDERSINAIGDLIPLLSPKSAIKFCRELDPPSYKWVMALYSLPAHPKSSIISYITELAASPDPVIRCFVYKICTRMEWDDCLQQAKLDQHNTTEIVLINQADDEKTLGQIATKYLSICPAYDNKNAIKRGQKKCQGKEKGSGLVDRVGRVRRGITIRSDILSDRLPGGRLPSHAIQRQLASSQAAVHRQQTAATASARHKANRHQSAVTVQEEATPRVDPHPIRSLRRRPSPNGANGGDELGQEKNREKIGPKTSRTPRGHIGLRSRSVVARLRSRENRRAVQPFRAQYKVGAKRPSFDRP
jgi:hypothetical protein